jgi:hypothetical protein
MTDRDLIEAKLRELYPPLTEAYRAAFANELAAALRESRKADVETVRPWIHDLAPQDVHAALSSLAGDE